MYFPSKHWLFSKKDLILMGHFIVSWGTPLFAMKIRRSTGLTTTLGMPVCSHIPRDRRSSPDINTVTHPLPRVSVYLPELAQSFRLCFSVKEWCSINSSSTVHAGSEDAIYLTWVIDKGSFCESLAFISWANYEWPQLISPDETFHIPIRILVVTSRMPKPITGLSLIPPTRS